MSPLSFNLYPTIPLSLSNNQPSHWWPWPLVHGTLSTGITKMRIFSLQFIKTMQRLMNQIFMVHAILCILQFSIHQACLGVNQVFAQKVMLKTQNHIIIFGPESIPQSNTSLDRRNVVEKRSITTQQSHIVTYEKHGADRSNFSSMHNLNLNLLFPVLHNNEPIQHTL